MQSHSAINTYLLRTKCLSIVQVHPSTSSLIPSWPGGIYYSYYHSGRKNKVGQRISIWGLKGILAFLSCTMTKEVKKGVCWTENKLISLLLILISKWLSLIPCFALWYGVKWSTVKTKKPITSSKKVSPPRAFVWPPSVTNYCWWNRLLRCCSITTKSSTSTECQLEQKYSIRAHRNKTSSCFRIVVWSALSLFSDLPLGDCTV